MYDMLYVLSGSGRFFHAHNTGVVRGVSVAAVRVSDGRSQARDTAVESVGFYSTAVRMYASLLSHRACARESLRRPLVRRDLARDRKKC